MILLPSHSCTQWGQPGETRGEAKTCDTPARCRLRCSLFSLGCMGQIRLDHFPLKGNLQHENNVAGAHRLLPYPFVLKKQKGAPIVKRTSRKHRSDLFSDPSPRRRRSRHAMEMCLCPRCAQQFYDSPDFFIQRRDLFQIEKDRCTFCSYRTGYDYRVYTFYPAALPCVSPDPIRI